MTITAGATDQTIYVEAVEDVGGTSPGEPKTGLINTNITGSYVRTREARVAITMATLAAASATHVDGGFIEVDAANTPGLYRTDLPDAAVATGLPEVIAFYEVATGSNALIRPLRIQISELDLQDGAAAGLTNLDAAISSVATDVWVQALTVSTATTTFGGVLDIAVSSRATSNVADFNNVAATEIWAQLTSVSTATTTFGGILDATISSRSTLASTDLNDISASAVWNEPLAANATATTLYGGLIQLQLDAAVSTRATSNVADFNNLSATEVWAQLTSVSTATTTFGGILDSPISSRANAADIWAATGDTATGPPPLDPTRAQQMDWAYSLSRNASDQTADTKTVFGSATTITLATAAVSASTSIFTRGTYG